MFPLSFQHDRKCAAIRSLGFLRVATQVIDKHKDKDHKESAATNSDVSSNVLIPKRV